MTPKLNIQSLPSDQKESENDDLSKLVRLLHEHTLANMSVEPSTQTINEFLSPTSIEQRSSSARMLRIVIENSAPNKEQLEVLAELESLRGMIEDLHRDYSAEKFSLFIESPNVPLKRLTELLLGPESPIDFSAFIQFGGLFVLLDILFLDHRFRTSGEKFVLKGERKSRYSARSRVFRLLGRLVDHSEEARAILRKSQPVLSLLADAYRASSAKDSQLIRVRIAKLFQSLAERDSRPDYDYHCDYRPCGIVRTLAETAHQCRTDKRKNASDELAVTLGALSALVKWNLDCRTDLFAVDGTIDMLTDLFSVPDRSGPKAFSTLLCPRYLSIMGLLMMLLIVCQLVAKFSDFRYSYEVTISLLIVTLTMMFMLTMIVIVNYSYRPYSLFRQAKTPGPAGQILALVAMDYIWRNRNPEIVKQWSVYVLAQETVGQIMQWSLENSDPAKRAQLFECSGEPRLVLTEELEAWKFDQIEGFIENGIFLRYW